MELMRQLEGEMPQRESREPTFSFDELLELALQLGEEHEHHVRDNLWMLGVPSMLKHGSRVGGAVSDGIQRVRHTDHRLKNLLWPRRLRDLDPNVNLGAGVGFLGATDTANDLKSNAWQKVQENARSVFNTVQDRFLGWSR